MQVELSKDKIISVHVDDSGESEGIANPVFERLPRDIIDGQTLNVDVISGATVTSQGIIDGIADAITQAGENPDILRARPKPVVQWSNETIEETTDIVVIGTGGAGLSAAATALDNNKEVIMLENSLLLVVIQFELVAKSTHQNHNGKIASLHSLVKEIHYVNSYH